MDDREKLEATKAFLFKLLSAGALDQAIAWLRQQTENITSDSLGNKIFMAFSQASRYFKRDLLEVSQDNLREIDKIVPGFRPDTWNRLRAARSYLLLHVPMEPAERFFQRLDKIFEMADLHEMEALYGSLPLLPYPEQLSLRAAEGLRTNITSVFDAIALHNPYPAQYLPEPAWNQMLIKAVFLQRPLFKITGADDRANEKLARIMVDFAHERWKAGRPVPPELWRFVGPFMNEQDVGDMEREIAGDNKLAKEAVLLAFSMSDLPTAQKHLEAHPEVKARIKNGELNWEDIGKRFFGES